MEILVSDEPDIELDIPNGLIMIKNFISVKIKEYNGILLVSHFKGHTKGGYGGALKNLLVQELEKHKYTVQEKMVNQMNF